MKSLTVGVANGEKRQLQSIGWRVPQENECRRQFFALDNACKPLVITLKPAMPEFYDANRFVRPVFSREPFPEAVCVEIVPCRLLAPPCYRSAEEFEGALPFMAAFDAWKLIYYRTHGLVLILGPEDDGPLKERLDEWLTAMESAYQCEAKGWRDKIDFVRGAPLEKLGFETEDQRAARLQEFHTQLDKVESENPIDGVPCKGRLKLTLNDVKNNVEGIRDAWMEEDWARKNGHDLTAMRRERGFFFKWLKMHTGTPANIIDATTRPSQNRHGIAPPSFCEKFESDPQFLEACAQVCYRARFADSANTVIYLSGFELREELTASEHNEVAELKDGQIPPANVLWHTEGFATVRRYNHQGKVVETLPLSNEFRALCQLLAERPDNIAQFSEVEPQIGTRTNELDTAAKVAKPAQRGTRRVRDMLRTKTARQLMEWGILIVQASGREKFLKLSPPKISD